jgi:hypothetical protein
MHIIFFFYLQATNSVRKMADISTLPFIPRYQYTLVNISLFPPLIQSHHDNFYQKSGNPHLRMFGNLKRYLNTWLILLLYSLSNQNKTQKRFHHKPILRSITSMNSVKKKNQQCPFRAQLFTFNATGRVKIATPIKILIELNVLCKNEDFIDTSTG